MVASRKASAIYLCDACQTAGQAPLVVDVFARDVLTATSRTFLRGQRGMRFLYVRRSPCEQLHPPFVDIRAAAGVSPDRYNFVSGARRIENWESDVAGKLGMGVAIDYALDLGLERIWATIAERAAGLRARLAAIPGMTVHDLGEITGGIVTFDVADILANDVQASLHRGGINTTVSGITSTRWNMTERGLEQVSRAPVP